MRAYKDWGVCSCLLTRSIASSIQNELKTNRQNTRSSHLFCVQGKEVATTPRVRRCRYPGCHAMCQLPDHYCKQHYEHEAEYLASRQKWARSHSTEYQRKYNNVTRYRDDTKSAQYHFYKSRQWQSLRKQALERDHYVCQYCGKPNSKTVDHVIPIEFDSKLQADTDNLATICRDCHRLKTAWEQQHYGTGKDNQLIAGAELVHDVDVIAKLMML